ncbi:MAG: lysophospholipid acyltransferase family protein [Endozoicomonas sp. (ex Botrylloides leachii)]|nr:lysophospholipid acyltransferase family protein [Endozoicomonas sp. (ex Botrylloides leachii)]
MFYPTLILLIINFVPYKKRHQLLAKNWSLGAIYLCRWICGVRWQVHGFENIPERPCVIISNHQSSWETFFLQTLVTPQNQVLKRELLNIPFFGWALRAIKPITINRSDPREAIKLVRTQGKALLDNDIPVLIFPEGTRNPNGELGKFSRGGSGLACSANVDILPIAHNAGKYWPNNRWIKTPGSIQVFIGKPMTTNGKGSAEVNNEVREWIAKKLASC